MQRKFILIAGISGALAVILGAFEAHQLNEVLADKQLNTFETGIRYHFFHTLAIFGAAIYLKQSDNSKSIILAIWLFLAGIVLFSGSLYLLATREVLGISSWAKILGPITPIGGLTFIIGWLLIAYSATKEST